MTLLEDSAKLLSPPTIPVFVEAEAAVQSQVDRFMSIGGTRSVDWFHRELGKIVWDYIGMERTKEGLEKAQRNSCPRRRILERPSLARVNRNVEFESRKAGRVADFFELAKLMARDALDREESCGGHFRAEHQTEEGEAQRDDDNFAHVAAWEWNGADSVQTRHQEELVFDNVALTQRSYK